MRVLALVSGGVDSAVAAALLQRQGHEVTAVFMKNWTPLDIQNPGDCPWQQDQDDAAAVAKLLGIPFRSVNFEKEYQRDVAQYFLQEYAAGRTPNPDIVCNQKIKFGAAWEWAQREGFDAIASGHYAKIVQRSGTAFVARGRDRSKDQSYFLATVPPKVLSHVLFPLGNFTKRRVRQMAIRLNLPVATKKDSQGICFVGHLPVRQFLQRSLKTKEGDVLTPNKVVIGKHAGASLYTIGQRHGWQVTDAVTAGVAYNVAASELPPLFVTSKNVLKNTITVDVVTSDALSRREFSIGGVVWHGPEFLRGLVQIRYRANPVLARLNPRPRNITEIVTRQPVWAVAPGQFVVLYRKGLVLGYGHVL